MTTFQAEESMIIDDEDMMLSVESTSPSMPVLNLDPVEDTDNMVILK